MRPELYRRGAVFVIPMEFPDREAPVGQHESPMPKWMVILRTPDSAAVGPPELDVPFVVASTLRVDRPEEPYELFVDATENGFKSRSVIDCRWVHTWPMSWVGDDYKFPLGDRLMFELNVRLMAGLQIRYAPPA